MIIDNKNTKEVPWHTITEEHEMSVVHDVIFHALRDAKFTKFKFGKNYQVIHTKADPGIRVTISIKYKLKFEKNG
jgi:hypothetical protein